MQDITGTQVLKVEGSPAGRGTRYAVSLAHGVANPVNGYLEQQPSTFENALATKAHKLTGHTVDARVEFAQSKKDPSKWFLNLVDIAPSGQLPPLAPTAGTAIPMAGAPTGGIPMAQPGQSNGSNPEREQRICRQWALGTAFEAVSVLYTGAGPDALIELKALALELGRELYALGYAGQSVEQPAAASPDPGTPIFPVATDPAAVAAQVNDVMGGAVAVGAPPAGAWS